MASTKQMIELGLAREGPGMQLYMGGSHGGFLGAHGQYFLSPFPRCAAADLHPTVIGQYPSFFSACVLRNPVTNIPAMYATTDIPDWTTVECGVPYNPGVILAPENYKIMQDMSPVRYIDKVITPVLLRIGDIDQRVPPAQGKEYYHLLRANGMGEKVQMLWYPENGHPLDKLEAERTGLEATFAWFQKYGSDTVVG